MKLRLTQGGFESYTGQMGVIFFENGLSVSDVLPVDAVRVAGVVGAEWEDGSPANVGQLYLDAVNNPAPVFERVVVEEVSEKASEKAPDIEAAVDPIVRYSEDDLAAVADKDGIAGLRKIAEPLGIKDKSIGGLMAAILKVAGTAKAQ